MNLLAFLKVILFRLGRACPCILALFLIALAARTSAAQIEETKKPAKQVLTLPEALALAAEQNKDIKKALEFRNMVQGRYVQERAAALPQLSFSGSISRSRDESQKAFSALAPVQTDTGGGQVTLRQVVFTWGQIGAAIRAANIGFKTADDQLKLFQQAVARDVSAAFYDALLAGELSAIAQQNIELKTRHLDESRAKYQAGTATDYDVLAAEVAVSNARPEVARAENLVAISRERLAILVGRDGRHLEVTGSLDAQITPFPDYQQAFATAVENRPEAADLRHRTEIQQELVTVAKAGNKPRLDLQASYGWQYLHGGAGEGNGQTSSIALYLTFPFFDGFRTQGLVEQAMSEFRSLSIEEAKLKDSISLQIFEALNALKESSEIVQALSGTVSQAERLVNMAEKGFFYGVKTNLDVQDAQLNLTQARGNLAKARRDYLVSQVTLQWVMGTINLFSVQ